MAKGKNCWVMNSCKTSKLYLQIQKIKMIQYILYLEFKRRGGGMKEKTGSEFSESAYAAKQRRDCHEICGE